MTASMMVTNVLQMCDECYFTNVTVEIHMKLLSADETLVQNAFIICKGAMLLSPIIRDNLMTSLEKRINNYQSNVTQHLGSVMIKVRAFYNRMSDEKNWWEILNAFDMITSLSNNTVENTNHELKSYKTDKKRMTDIGIVYSCYEWMITK